MARYVTTMRTPRPPADVFAFMADFRNLGEWDPSIKRVRQVVGVGPGPTAEFEVTISNPGRDLTLRYRTVDYSAPTTVRLIAHGRVVSSDDRITVAPEGDGSLLVYDARLSLIGPLRIADPLLGLALSRIGDRATRGLRRALDGTAVD